MTKNNTTKKALGSSIFALFMCVMMLIGTTFAWFTDTASTAVNKIQAGTLKVDIVKASDNSSIKGKSMSFVNKESSADILWEPGVTFKTDGFKIKNDGNLALKYKLQLNGINGSSKLLEVIEFSVVNESGTAVDLDTFEGNLQPAATTSDGSEYSGTYYIQGHMKESAGNEYQGLDIEGIGITVVATQLASEFDSYGNTYDADAVYPAVATLTKVTASGKVADSSTATTITDTGSEDNATVIATVPAGTVDAGKTVALTVERTDMTADSVTFEIDFKVDNVKQTSVSNVITAKVDIGTGLKNVKVTHNGTAMTEATTGADQTYSYDSSSGILTIVTKTFSPFMIEYKTDFEASTNGIGYATLAGAVSAANEGDTVTLAEKNVTLSSGLSLEKGVKINLNKKTLTLQDTNGWLFFTDKTSSVSNGTIVGGKYGCYAEGNSTQLDISNVTFDETSIIGVCADSGATVNVSNVEITAVQNPIQAYGGNIVLNNVTANQLGTAPSPWYDSAIQVVNGIKWDESASKWTITSQANATINSGKYTGKRAIQVNAPGGNVTVNGGTFTGTEYLLSAEFVKANYKDSENYESKIVINDGTFDGKIHVSNDASLTIKGGTFKNTGLTLQQFKAYVASGYTATESNGTYTVTAN